MFLKVAWVIVNLANVLFASPQLPELHSPCRQVFKYESVNPGKWTGILTIIPNVDLYGTWARIILSKPPSEPLTVDGPLIVVSIDNSNEFLLKNKSLILRENQPISVKITAKYQGEAAPAFVGYRLNARIVCSEDAKLIGKEAFENDFNVARNFTSRLSPKHPSPLNEQCSEGDASWQAPLFIKKSDGIEEFLCDASIIGPYHLVTAAHCVTWKDSRLPLNPDMIFAYTNRASLNSSEGSTKIKVEAITVHPGYSVYGLSDNLAVIELKTKTLSKPICLSNKEENKEEALFVHGYDRAANKEPMTKVHIDKCEKYALDGTFCAKYIKDEECIGLSGSSVSVQTLRGWELKGVITLGGLIQQEKGSTCSKSTQIVSTKIANYIHWIAAAVSKRSIN